MPSIHKGILKQLRTIDAKYVDQRAVSEQDLRLYVWFHEYLYNEILDLGGQERGYTFRERGDTCLLIYKATFDDIPQVVFVTSQTPVGCMRIFCRQFYADKLRWTNDKYG